MKEVYPTYYAGKYWFRLKAYPTFKIMDIMQFNGLELIAYWKVKPK